MDEKRDGAEREHVPADILERYARQLSTPNAPHLDEPPLTAREAALLATHLETCPDCERKVQERCLAPPPTDAPSVPQVPVDDEARVRRRATLLVVGMILLGTAFLVGVDSRSRPVDHRFLELASVSPEEVAPAHRDVISDESSRGVDLLLAGRYLEALAFFEEILETRPDDDVALEAHFHAGVASLLAASSGDLALLRRSQGHLREASTGSTSPARRQTAYWFLGKAYLREEDVEQARLAFENVVRGEGDRAPAAEEVLDQLDRIEALMLRAPAPPSSH